MPTRTACWTDARTTTQGTTIGIGVKNNGEKAAGETLVNVVVPRSLDYAQWVGPDGHAKPDGERTAETGEMLPDDQGEETIASKFVMDTWSRVGTRSHYEKFVKIPVDLPPAESGLSQATVPIRVRVQADELPDEIDEYVIDYTVRVVRRRGTR